MNRLCEVRSAFPCGYLYPQAPEILKKYDIKASDVKDILEIHVSSLTGLSYDDREKEAKLYKEVIKNCGDFGISKESAEMYKEFYNILCCIFMFTCFAAAILGVYISLIKDTTLLCLCGFCFTSLFIIENYFVVKFINRFNVAVASNILVIHALEQQQQGDRTTVSYTLKKIIEHKL